MAQPGAVAVDAGPPTPWKIRPESINRGHPADTKVNFPWVANAFDPWGPIVTPCSRAVLMMVARLSPHASKSAFSVGLVGLVLVFVVIGVLYGVGAIQVLTSTGQGHHTTHLFVSLVLAVGALILARFAWPERSR